MALEARDAVAAEDARAWRAALVRNKQRAGLFYETPGAVEFRGERLFTTRLELPTAVPTGRYRVDVYLLADGVATDRSTTVLEVQKVGLGAEVFEFAHREAAAYGALAIVVALVAGWFAGFVFRRA